MERHDEIIELLTRIEQNQQQALRAQEKQLALAEQQFARSNERIKESVDLQRQAMARAAQVRNFVFPLVLVLLALRVYLIVRWRML